LQKQKIITRTVLLLSLVSLFNDIASEILYPVMPVYLKSIGFTIAAIGLLEGVAEATAGLTKGYFGNLSDNMGKRLPFVQFGYGLTALSRILLAFFTSIPIVFTARLSDRVGKGVRTAARDAMLSTEATPSTKASVFGFHRSFDTIGAAIGPMIALVFLYYYPEHYRTLLLFTILPCLFAVFTTFIVKEKRLEKPEVKNYGFFHFLGYWKIAAVPYKKTVIRLLIFALVNSADVFLLLLLKEKGYSDVQMIGFYIFYNLVYAATAYPIGKIADKLGLIKIIVTGLILFSLVYVGINFTNNFMVIGLLFFVYGIYAACFESTSKAFITLNCKPAETATAIGFYSGFASIASLIASTWTGLVWYKINPQAALIFSGTVTLIIAIAILYTSSFRWKLVHP
jgi:MFS family permease